MLNWFVFSNKIHKFKKQFVFLIVVIYRFIKITFKSNRNIKEIYFNYPSKYVFENGNVIIDFYFQNVLWYEIKGVYKTTKHQSISLNPDIIKFPIEFIVQGVFRKNVYVVEQTSQYRYNFSQFNAAIKNPEYNLSIIKDTFAKISNISSFFKPILRKNKVEISSGKIQIKTNKIKLQYTKYNQNDFI